MIPEHFLDADKIKCIWLDTITNTSFIPPAKTWDIRGRDCMALADYLILKRFHDDGLNEADFDMTMVVVCDECGTVMLPDDEAYFDGHDFLCDDHSAFEEGTDIKCIRVPQTI